MKILLIWPKARTDPEWGGDLGAIGEPLALEYLAAGVKKQGREVRILDLRLHPDILDETLLEFRPDIIGITAFSMHVLAALANCKRAKELLENVVTVVGGHHATLLPEDFFEPQMDYVVVGEGVYPFNLLVEAVENGHEVPEIPGLYRRSEEGFTLDAPPREFEIESLPFPDRQITLQDRSSYFIDWMSPVALLRSTVGCPYRCTFCSLWRIMDKRYHKRATEKVVEELLGIQEEYVFLIDDEAFIDGPRMIELARAIKAAGIRKRFFAYCRVDSIIREQEVLREWTDIGLERLMVGIDAISEKDLTEYKKAYGSSRIEEALEIADKLGIEILAQFVVNTDYTKKDFKYLSRFVEHHKIQYPSFTVLTPIPGTDIYNLDKIIERQPNNRPNWDYFDTQNAVVKTALPKEEFRKEYRGLYDIFRGAYTRFLVHKPFLAREKRIY